MKATVRDLRLRARELIEASARGEEVVITFRGEPKAVLIGWRKGEPPKTTADARNPAFGLWADRAGKVERQVRNLRNFPAAPRY